MGHDFTHTMLYASRQPYNRKRIPTCHKAERAHASHGPESKILNGFVCLIAVVTDRGMTTTARPASFVDQKLKHA